jgi:hypothetical protein
MLKVIERSSSGKLILVEKRQTGSLYIMKTFKGEYSVEFKINHPFLLIPSFVLDAGSKKKFLFYEF